MRFKNKVVLITGASRGIGKATALLFAKEGAKIIINYFSNKQEAEVLVKKIKKLKAKAIAIQADVSNPAQVEHLFSSAVKSFGAIDILVNNAGIVNPKSFLDLTFEDMEKTFHTNVIGPFLCSQQACKIMLKNKQNKGKIINLASIRGLEHCGRQGVMDYSASKAAIVNFTKTLAKEVAPFINVNAVAPGLTETDMAKNWDNAFRKCAIESTPLKRLMQPEDIAKAILFLASSEADAITGEVLVVDGGNNLKL